MPPRRKKFQVPRKTTSSEGPPRQVTPPPGPSKPTPNRAASRPLTAEQQAAVDAPLNAPLAIVAGAGSGKTETLTRRVARAVAEGGLLERAFDGDEASKVEVRPCCSGDDGTPGDVWLGLDAAGSGAVLSGSVDRVFAAWSPEAAADESSTRGVRGGLDAVGCIRVHQAPLDAARYAAGKRRAAYGEGD